MANDRSADRHPKGSRHQITLPAELWSALGRMVGNGNRSLRIRELVEADLDGVPAPPWPGQEGDEPAT